MVNSANKHKPRKKNPRQSEAPAKQFFAATFNHLLGMTGARNLETGRVRRAKCTSLAHVLKNQRVGPALRGTSESSLYRLSRGETSPTIEVVYELAKAFKVSPRVFLPEHADDCNPTTADGTER